MKMVHCWNDLQMFGLDCLTGEACGLNYRILFDAAEQGRKVLAKCFGIPKLTLAEAWNRGTDRDPHVGSIMLSQEMLIPVGIFALLESGCSEVWLDGNSLFGIEPADLPDYLDTVKKAHPSLRRFAYRGTAGDRNLHMMSGRVQ